MDEIEKLKKENEQLKQINKNKSDIISITAHQLRTSLSALKWILKMLIDKDMGKLSTEQDELIKKAYSGNERMLILVNDLLTLSHTEDASISYNFQKIDILKLIETTILEFYGETNKKGIELILLTPDTTVPFIKCDEEMIKIVIQNLIENSIKYSEKGGKVFISINKEEDNIKISVNDNGIGIDDIDKDNIFKKFFRASNAIKKDSMGSGLGLFIIKNIVEKHNGKIWFENVKNKGTTFYVILPIA